MLIVLNFQVFEQLHLDLLRVHLEIVPQLHGLGQHHLGPPLVVPYSRPVVVAALFEMAVLSHPIYILHTTASSTAALHMEPPLPQLGLEYEQQ